MDNIRQIPTKPDEFAAAIEGLRRNLDNFVEHAKLVAAIKRAYFDALVKEGFTAEQALELTKASVAI
ncbi:hypothetical protein QAY90_gp17 [Xanthomonas phage Langgrundblatt2]|uniref:Uncharacterized protein n=1 Tax=Xanthomonas phage Langgrundblatt2 TaxID=2939129 RepID=A0A9E7E176_9CAUD|nr:hypothetical protein QAY90_gp17 [Xanthomonas phage Langgrundblatt2]URA06848.1 hypothetical protein Langgrundblatt2_BL20017 [Xanthomonas phage Langgrundblatt2]